MPAVLVTGVAGFIGSHVARQCISLGFSPVIGLDDLSGGSRDNVPDRVQFIEGDVRDTQLVTGVFKEQQQQGDPIVYVYHLAAYAAENLSHWIRKFNYEVNVVGSMNLISASVEYGVKVFVFTSSIAVYGHGNRDGKPFNEELTPKPQDPYGIAKYTVEMDLKCAHDTFGLNFIVFRPHNVYGPGQSMIDRYRNVVGIFTKKLLHAQDLPIFGDGEQTRAFTYIDDVSAVIARSPTVAGAWNQVFNIGHDDPVSINTLAKIVIQQYTTVKGSQEVVQRRHLPPRHEVVHAWCRHDKVRRVFGQVAVTDLVTGVQRTVQWAWQNKDKTEVKGQGSEPFGELDIKRIPTPFQ